MRTAMSEIDVRSAESLAHALTILHEERRQPVAGATDVYVAANFGTLETRQLLDIWALDELRGISLRGDTVVIGALSSYTSLIKSPIIAERLPMLIDASRLIGGPQIQNRGTVGGNIANGSPAGDSLPVFSAVDAIIVLRSATNERRSAWTQAFIVLIGRSNLIISTGRPDQQSLMADRGLRDTRGHTHLEG